MAKEWDNRTLPRSVFLLKITMQQQKCINLNRKHLRLIFLIINLTKNNIAWIQTNILKVRSITSTFIILAESKVYGIVVKSFIQMLNLLYGDLESINPFQPSVAWPHPLKK